MIKQGIGLLLLLTLLTGCLNKYILDDVRLVTAIGYESINSDEVRMTAVVPLFRPDQSTASETHTANAKLTTEVNEELNKSASKPLVLGKLDVLVYHTELAEKGLLPLVDILVRDPSIGTRAFITVTDAQVNQLLSGQYGSQDNGMYISDMIDQNIKAGLLPQMNFHIWKNGLHGEGRDPYAPIINQHDNKVKITGIALFEDDQMVGEIDSDSLFTFKTLVQTKSDRGIFITELENEEVATIYKVKGKRIIEISQLNQKPNISVKIELNGIIKEHSGGKVDEQSKQIIEKSMEDKIKEQATEMILKFQELNIDPIGFGDELRSKLRHWNKQQWEDTYSNSKIDVNVDITITEAGIAN